MQILVKIDFCNHLLQTAVKIKIVSFIRYANLTAKADDVCVHKVVFM